MWSPAALGIYSITVWLAVVPKYLWLCEKMGKMCLRKVWLLIKKQGLSGVTDPGGWLPSGHHYPSVPSHKPHPAAPPAGEQRRSLRWEKAEPTRIKDKATTSLEQVGREAHFSAVPAGLRWWELKHNCGEALGPHRTETFSISFVLQRFSLKVVWTLLSSTIQRINESRINTDIKPALLSSTKKNQKKLNNSISDKNTHITVFQIRPSKRPKLYLVPVAISGWLQLQATEGVAASSEMPGKSFCKNWNF